MKPGDIAIVRCKREPGLNMRCVILLERVPSVRSGKAATWICLLGGRKLNISSGWLFEAFDEAR